MLPSGAPSIDCTFKLAADRVTVTGSYEQGIFVSTRDPDKKNAKDKLLRWNAAGREIVR